MAAFVVQLGDIPGNLAAMEVDTVPEVALHHNRPAADDSHVVHIRLVAAGHNPGVAVELHMEAVHRVVVDTDLEALVADLVQVLHLRVEL